MNLSGLLSILERVPAYRRLRELYASGDERMSSVVDLAASAKPLVLAGLQQVRPGAMLVLTAEAHHARRLFDSIVAYSGLPERALLFPSYRGLFYERVASDPAVGQQRLAALAALFQGEGLPATVVVADLRSALQRLPEPDSLVGRRFAVKRGAPVGLRALLERLMAMGYEPVTTVVEPGAFAHRGGIVDVFSTAADQPYRLEFFGDEVDSVRYFDPLTQRSVANLEEAVIAPARELTPALARATASALANLDLSTLRAEVRERWLADIEALRQGEVSPLGDPYTPFVGTRSMVDYLGAGMALVLDDPARIAQTAEALASEAETLYEDLKSRGELPHGLPKPYFEWRELGPRLGRHTSVVFTQEVDAEKAGTGAWPFSTPASYGGRLKVALDDCQALLARGTSVVLTTNQADRVAELLAERDLHVKPVPHVEREPAAGTLTLVKGTILEGWRAETLNVAVWSDGELFGWAKPRPITRRRPSLPPVLLSDLSPGDFVVHVDHGLGRYQGMTQLAVDGVTRDYLVLEYAAGDRMFVPTDQADRVGKYHGAGEEPPVLHRLGSGEWARAKERVKASARDIAKELLEIYAARQLAPGHAYQADSPWQSELEASFPYVETPDQIQAVAEVKTDMESPRPMDRLISGDVGYGKTEVALRAAFKAVMDGKQVAVLVPTTVLAQQHYSTFQERLQAFPVKVEVLSRFRSPKAQKRVLEALAAGSVDVVVGTHRLLQKDVAFKNLGLLVVDEEHRFGVAHKERLKRLRKEIDVLTLSATPIPRTLHMSLAGVRDMSTIATPPDERLPIKTFLSEYRESTVREAILRELDRGGQIFFVHNRVHDIYRVADEVARLVPEARVTVGHGQMPENQLERVMLDFADGAYDVLVCTTIIESGLDMPNVNTIIVHQAERYGLAQLYQLRGRVGRSASRAYAYLMYSRNRRLTPEAEKRLRTIFEATELGAGFQIALKDLEIRGAGNLLGAEQHGHIAAVGFDLYTRLLAEAVEELRGKAPRERKPAPVSVDLPLAAYLPPDYVADDATRLNLYQRLAAVSGEEEAGRLALEVRDRFGPPPAEVVNLLYLVQLKATAARLGIQSIAVEGDQLVLRFTPSARPDRAEIIRQFGRQVTLTANTLRLDRRRLGAGWQHALQQMVDLCGAGQAVAG